MALTSLFAKLYILILFYSFYFLVRDVVFFEHILQSTEALNADPAFNDSGSNHSSQISAGIFSLTPRMGPSTPNRRNVTNELR